MRIITNNRRVVYGDIPTPRKSPLAGAVAEMRRDKRHTHTTREVQAEGIEVVEVLEQARPEPWGRFHPTQTATTMPSDPQRESVF